MECYKDFFDILAGSKIAGLVIDSNQFGLFAPDVVSRCKKLPALKSLDISYNLCAGETDKTFKLALGLSEHGSSAG